MNSIPEHVELIRMLRSKSGKDLLTALPLVSAHIKSAVILDILRGCVTTI